MSSRAASHDPNRARDRRPSRSADFAPRTQRRPTQLWIEGWEVWWRSRRWWPDKSSEAAGQVFDPDRPHKSLQVRGQRPKTKTLVTGLTVARASDMPSKPVWGRELPGGFDSRPPPLRRDQRKRASEGITIRSIGPVGLDVGRWCIVDVSMLEDGFEQLLAGKDDVRVLVKVRGLRSAPDTHGTANVPATLSSCLTTADSAGGSCRP
jgi:hypothetical protein